MNNVIELSINTRRRSQQRSIQSNVIALNLKNDAIDTLITEGGEDFYRYFRSTDHSSESNLIVLSSQHHYYYDTEELKGLKSVVILKKLNSINEIENFLHSHLNFLPDQCNLIGCFVNNTKVNRYALRAGRTRSEKSKYSDNIQLGIVSRFPFLNMIYSFMDSRTNEYMSVVGVTFLLGLFGFKVLNMKESKGLTFFHARKIHSQFNGN